ncbi:MAG: hypothetical protein V8T01_10090 [Oscillospiraceae bacterium]
MTEQKMRGAAVIYVGEDLDVLLELCDRILVLCGGKVSGIVDGRAVTKEEIGLMITRRSAGRRKRDPYHNETKAPLIRLAKRGVMEPWKASCIRVGSILVALLLGGLVMSIALPEGSNIFSAYGTIIEGALGKKTAIRQTIKLAVPLLGAALAIAQLFSSRCVSGTSAPKARSRRAPWPRPISRCACSTRCPPRCC